MNTTNHYIQSVSTKFGEFDANEFVRPEPVLIKAQNVGTYVYEHGLAAGWTDLLNFKYSNPPFPNMKIEFDVPIKLFPESVRSRIHFASTQSCMNVHEAPKDFKVVRASGIDNDKVLPRIEKFKEDLLSKGLERFIILDPVPSDLSSGKSLYTILGLDKNGSVLAGDDGTAYVRIMDNDYLEATKNWHVSNIMDYETIVVLATLNFMNCRNVEIVDNPPSRQVRRRCEQKGEPLPVTYKTLVIRPNLRRRKEIQQTGGFAQERALHIVRGHFKDYTKGRGLGRGGGHGVWWWSPAVRGTSTTRAVVKDYEVEVN